MPCAAQGLLKNTNWNALECNRATLMVWWTSYSIWRAVLAPGLFPGFLWPRYGVSGPWSSHWISQVSWVEQVQGPQCCSPWAFLAFSRLARSVLPLEWRHFQWGKKKIHSQLSLCKVIDITQAKGDLTAWGISLQGERGRNGRLYGKSKVLSLGSGLESIWWLIFIHQLPFSPF